MAFSVLNQNLPLDVQLNLGTCCYQELTDKAPIRSEALLNLLQFHGLIIIKDYDIQCCILLKELLTEANYSSCVAIVKKLELITHRTSQSLIKFRDVLRTDLSIDRVVYLQQNERNRLPIKTYNSEDFLTQHRLKKAEIPPLIVKYHFSHIPKKNPRDKLCDLPSQKAKTKHKQQDTSYHPSFSKVSSSTSVSHAKSFRQFNVHQTRPKNQSTTVPLPKLAHHHSKPLAEMSVVGKQVSPLKLPPVKL